MKIIVIIILFIKITENYYDNSAKLKILVGIIY